jgi:hypothetical protein
MSLRPDGTYRCDRCGTDVGNAGVDRAAHIMDTQPDDLTLTRHLHLCLDRPNPKVPGDTIQGCRDRVLTRRALRWYREQQEAEA